MTARPGIPTGAALLHDPLLNKGTAFTAAERTALGLQGLLPPYVHTIEEQEARVMENYRHKETDLERYIHLISLQDRNETLFYRVLQDHLEEMLPIVYTPTVGQACQLYSHLFRRPRGLYVSIEDRGRVSDLLRHWPHPDVRVIVVTDGERILGLGDQGLCGMGIPVGKLSLYTACAGIAPSQCLPVTMDVGTENAAYLTDPLYIGLRRRRVRGPEYDALLDEFVTSVGEWMPKAMVQFEDFGNTTAFQLLRRWRERICTFNDDIQGTAAVALAGLFSSLRITGRPLIEQKILFLGAGEAGTGIADLIVTAIVDAGVPAADALKRCWFVDSKGLVVKSRDNLASHKVRYAHDFKQIPDFLSAVRALQPTVIVGVSTVGGAFTREVVELMSQLNARPIIFALSNPTSSSECTAEQAYTWSAGRAVFASGSPFPAFTFRGTQFVPGQGNNAYVFPGIGLGVLASEAKRISDRMFFAAACTLADAVQESDLVIGRIYPSMQRIHEVSERIAAAVAKVAFDEKLARVDPPADLMALVKSRVWEPKYESYV
jgi:malate dehydrogenase (oxaloacetate-decarboxylating)(NADP+)